MRRAVPAGDAPGHINKVDFYLSLELELVEDKEQVGQQLLKGLS